MCQSPSQWKKLKLVNQNHCFECHHFALAIETLEKMAGAFEVPMYQLFYDGEEPPKPLNLPKRKIGEDSWGSTGKDARYLNKLRDSLTLGHPSVPEGGKYDRETDRLFIPFLYSYPPLAFTRRD